MATVLSLLNAAAEELEVIPSGGSLTTAEQTSALDRFNRMLDAASATPGLIFAERIDQLTLTTAKQKYTIGFATSDFNIDRPERITRANLLLTSTIRKPMAVITPEQWAGIQYQNAQGPPRALYYDGAFNLNGEASMYFFEIPNAAYDFEFFSWQQFAQAATVGATIAYPPAYSSYWLYGLAIRLAPMFGRTVSPDLRESFRQANEIVTALNGPSPMMHTDRALLIDGGEIYNWRSGTME